MPRAAQYKIPAIQELLRQLEYAPVETRRRQMDATEALIADLDPQQNYPEDFIIYRITGYRPDRVVETVTFVGQALLPDLVNLVQTLSEKLGLRVDECEQPVLTMQDVADRLHISQKTVQRYRKQGLVCHYFMFPDRVQRLGCFENVLKRFVERNQRQTDDASSFTRIDSDVEARIVSEARQLRERDGLSLNETARRLAKAHQRAHETIRMLLRRHDARRAHEQEAIFDDAAPLSPREIILIHRGWQRGIDTAALVERTGKSKPTIHRAINRRRRDLLRTLRIEFIKLPTFNLPDATEVILSAPAVIQDLDPPGRIDALELIGAAREEGPIAIDVEHSLLAGYNLLKSQSYADIAKLGDAPASESLDRIETNLRWSSMVRRRLARLGFPAALLRIEQNCKRPLQTQSIDEITELMALAAKVVSSSIESIDPSRGQRLERVISLAMDKALAKIIILQSDRASARHSPGAVPTNNRFEVSCEWDRLLNLRADLVRHVRALERRAQQTILLRYGLEGTHPLTISEVAALMGLKHIGIVRLLQRSIGTLRGMVRQSD